jgi:hypothetical protein
MRKLLLWILFGIPFLANAQFKKGDAYVGGDLSGLFGITTNVSPFVGFFINPRVALGGYVQMGYSRSTQDSIPGQALHRIETNQYYSVALTARKFYLLSEKFYFALQGDAFFSRSFLKQKTDDYTSNLQSYGLGITVSPVFIYFPSKHWSLEGGLGSLGYRFYRSLSGTDSGHYVDLSVSGVKLGVAYYFFK